MPKTATPKRKRCSECGELKPADEVRGHQMCEDCESEHDYCTICNTFVHRDGRCRHIKWGHGGYITGCGSGHVADDAHKESFQRLMRLFLPLTYLELDGVKRTGEKPLLPKVLSLIEANNFWTTWVGYIIGPSPDLCLEYEKRPGFVDTLRRIYEREQAAWGPEEIEACQDGMDWLTSLEPRTVEANKLTAEWIREVLAA